MAVESWVAGHSRAAARPGRHDVTNEKHTPDANGAVLICALCACSPFPCLGAFPEQGQQGVPVIMRTHDLLPIETLARPLKSHDLHDVEEWDCRVATNLCVV